MILVDTSIWIGYFKGDIQTKKLEELIDANILCVNDIILAELLPHIKQQKEYHLSELILSVTKTDLEIDWNEIIEMQTKNIMAGINKVGLPDLLITQNVLQNSLELFTFDKHFELMSSLFGIKLFAK